MSGVMMFVSLFGGLGIFLYGMKITSDGLQKAAVNKIKYILEKLTKSPFLGVFVGVTITFLLQSSSATTVLLVGFVSAGLMRFTNAIGVIMGSAIGTTLTVQLIAFKITDYALLFVAIGSLTHIFSNKKIYSNIGEVLLGFGLIFYGMGVMSNAMVPLKDSDFFLDLILNLTGHPIITIIFSTVFTGIIQSSAATLAVTMSLVTNNVIAFSTAIPIMLGANIGTTATALISSLASSKEAKRVAVANFIFKFIGVLIFLIFLKPFTNFFVLTENNLTRQIANSHTFFNLAITFLILPFSSKFAAFIMKLMPEDEKDDSTVKFIDDSSLKLPDIALWQTKNEILRLAKIINDEMFTNMLELVERNEMTEYLYQKEKIVDEIYLKITKFLTGLVQNDLNEEQSEKQVMYLSICKDLENIGDIIFGTTRLSNKMKFEGITFSENDWEELKDMKFKINNNFNKIIEAISDDDSDAATDILKNQPEMARAEKELRFNHFIRISCQSNEELENTSIYLDLSDRLFRINQHLVSIAQANLGIV